MESAQLKHPANGDDAQTGALDDGERWRNEARCRDLGWQVFFPAQEDGPESDDAKAICAECPVAADCLWYALTAKEDYGVWGGTTPHERRQLRRRPRKTA